MKKLRRNFERFCYNHQNWGLPNLMMYIAIGNVLVYFLNLADPSNMLAQLLVFDRSAILHGQIWRLFSYVFTYLVGSNSISFILSLLMLYFYWQFGRMLEQQWGVLRFNLYYFSGILFLDLGAMLLGGGASSFALNRTLFLAVATLLPELRFLVFYIIPVKAKYLAWFYFGITAWDILTGIAAMLRMLPTGEIYLIWLAPFFVLANYFLFFGSDITNILPDRLRYRKVRTKKSRPARSSQPNPNWAQNYRSKSGEKPYRHKCTVCGRTDTENPALEFRYCSRCNGYYCYCMDHINNHVHIT